MRQCYLNGNDHAALVTACALLDSGVKDAIYFKVFVKANCVFDPGQWDTIDALEFGPAINLAKREGVVSKQEWKDLDWIRQHIRNVYMHGQTPEWIKDENETFVEGNLETGEAREVSVRVRDNIVLQRYIRICADRNICDRVVGLVDWFVRTLNQRAVEQLEEWKTANPFRPTEEQVKRAIRTMQGMGWDKGVIAMSELPDDVPAPPGQSGRPSDGKLNRL